MLASADECARQVLATIPRVMGVIRSEVRRHRESDLTVPQFRVLNYLNRHEGASLSDVAGHMGLSLPTLSKMVDSLVGRQLVIRQIDAADRRRVVLAPTELGRNVMRSALEAAQARLAERLSELPASELSAVSRAMQALEAIFAASGEIKTEV